MTPQWTARHALLLLSVVLLLALTLWQVRRYTEPEAVDELLAYEISPAKGVTLPVPPNVERILVSSWLLLRPGSDTDQDHPYTVRFELTGSDATTQLSQDLTTRVDPLVSDNTEDSARFLARLPGSTEWVCEPRSFELNTAVLKGKQGTLRVFPADSRVLLRLSHREPRTQLESEIRERTLALSGRVSLMAKRSSLGFFDLPQDKREAALSTRVRRLTALGADGTDYQTRRLVLGDRFASQRLPQVEELTGIPLQDTQCLAFNTQAPTKLTLQADPGSRFKVNTLPEPERSEATPAPATVSAKGELVIHAAHGSPATTQICAEQATRVRMLIDPELKPQLIAHERLETALVAHGTGSGLMDYRPDQVVFPLYRLSDEPAREFGASPGAVAYPLGGAQTQVFVTARTTSARSAVLRADIRDTAGRLLSTSELRLTTELAHFERLLAPEEDGSVPVTEPVTRELRLPAGARRLELRGDPEVLASVSAPEPFVTDSLPVASYQHELPDGFRWRYAPQEVKSWAVLIPDNQAQLRRSQRRWLLTAQPRIAKRERTRRSAGEDLLTPVGAHHRVGVFTPTTLSEKSPLPNNAWVPITTTGQGQTRLVTASELQLQYATSAARLGASWSLQLDGQPKLEEVLSFQTGTRTLETTPGAHEIRVEGLGEGGVLLGRARPATGHRIFRRQTAVALEKAKDVVLVFPYRAGELNSVVLILFSEGGNADIGLRYELDGGNPKLVQHGFFERLSSTSGSLELRTGVRGRAWVQDPKRKHPANSLPDRVGSVTLPLGDDLDPGMHSLRIRRTGGSPARFWLRAVLTRTLPI